MAEHAALEARIAALLAAEDLPGAATMVITGYGPEILGYLLRICGDDDRAQEAFSTFSEDLWRGLSGFQGRASMRTWAYRVARSAMARGARRAARDARYITPLSGHPEADRLAQVVRSTTVPSLRTAEKARVARLRAALSPIDDEVLVLRVDRGMHWSEVAMVLGDGHTEAALRKRFERIKDRLRRLVAQERSTDDAGDPGDR